MDTFSWAANASGDWNTGTLWTPTSVPNTATADVTIDAATTFAYTVTIAPGETETVHSLSMNGTNNFVGTYGAIYAAAELELDGTLVFAAGSAGALLGSAQTYVHEQAGATAAILNAGNLNAFIQAEGTLLLSGTNSVYISNEIEALGGTVTIAAPFANVNTTNTLIDGIFNATGPAATINLGSASAGQIVNIATVAGAFGYAGLTLSGPTAAINEWNGTTLVPVETTLRKIGAGGTVDILGGRNYTSNTSLTIDETLGSSFFGPAMLNLQAGTVAIAGGININGGVVQGYGTINGAILNNGTMIALGGTIGGTLNVLGSLTGTGAVAFDKNVSTGGDPTEAALSLHSVSSGQTITMNDGGDTLILATPTAFAGTIVAGKGGRIILQGPTAASASLNLGILVVRNAASQTVASLVLAGSYAGDSFITSGSVVTILAPPTISGTTARQAVSDRATITPFAGVVIGDSNSAQTEVVSVTLSDATNGTLTNLGGGAYNAASGVYNVTGSAAAVTAALDGLVFTPTPSQIFPGLTITTLFAITVADTAAKSTTNSTTTVITTAATSLPTISGAAAPYTISDQQTIAPFAHMTIADANYGQIQNVKVTLSDAHDGTLSSTTGAGSYDAADGIYNVSGSAAVVTAALNGLVFTPTPHEAAPGQVITTTFAVEDTDTAGQFAIDRTTTVQTTELAVAPTISGAVAGQTISDQSTIAPFARMVIADANFGQTETVTVTPSPSTLANGTLINVGAGTYNTATGVFTITGPDSVVAAMLNSLVFLPTLHQVAPGQTVTTGFTVTVTDTASKVATNGTTSVITTAGTATPTISAALGVTPTISDLATIAPFSDVAIGDANFGQTETVTISLSTPANGLLIALGGGTYDAVNGVYRVTGTTSQVTAAVDALVFDPTPHLVAPGGTIATTFTIHDIDTALKPATDATRTVVTIASTALPTITGAMGGQTVPNQGTILPFASVQINDVNFGQTETLTVALSTATNGTLTNLGGGSYNAASGVYTVTGSAIAVTHALDGLVFTPAAPQGAPSQVFTRFTISDSDSAGQSQSDSTTTVITDAVIAAAPTIGGTVGGQPVSDQGTIRPFASVSIGDDNIGQTETVTITLSSAGNGTLTNLGIGTYNTQTGVYSVTGSAAAVTAALKGWVFTPTAQQVAPGQAVTTTFTISDTDTASQTATNIATTVIATAGTVLPTIGGALPGQAVSDQATIAPFATVAIGDLNVGQIETLTVALSVPANGTLSNPARGTYDPVSGIYTVIGTPAAVTTALRALVFTPAAHQVAPGATVTTTFTISDTDSALANATNSATTVIATAGTVLPTIGGTLANQPASDQGTIAPFGSVVIGDLNVGQTETLTVTLSAPANGTLTNLGGGSYNPQTGAYSVTGSAAAVTSALKGWIFTPTAHQVPPGATTTTIFTISDIDSARATATNSTTSVITTAGTVAPTISVSGSNPPISDQATISPFANVSIADLNVGQTETVTVSLLAANGVLTNLGAGSYNPQTGVYSMTGSAAEVTSALQALVFTPTLHQVLLGKSVTTTFTISDTNSAGKTATDSSRMVVANATAVAPTISGSVPSQTTSDMVAIRPFASVTIRDGNPSQTETVTVTLSAKANGTLTNLGPGTYNAGVYSVTGPPATVTAALAALVFTPTAHQVAAGNTVVTSFTISDTDTAQQIATDSSTTVIATGTASAAQPTISGTAAGWSTSDEASISPFAHVVIADASAGQTETVTVTLSTAANGVLTNLGGGAYNASAGVYTVTGSTAAVSATVQALVFVPTRAQVAGGQTVTTGLTLSVTDTAGASTTDTATRVVTTAVTAPAGEVILSGSSAQYVILDDNGTLYVQDTVAGRNGVQVLPGISVMSFTNGFGLFDPTGTAENVARLYEAAFNRGPELNGVQYWTSVVDGSNVPLAAVANYFATSPEFIQDYGALSDPNFVQQLYQNVLSRAADAAGLQYWTGLMASGTSRGTVLLGFAESPEFKADTLSIAGDSYNAEAYRLYTAALNRTPDAAGQIYWAGQLASGTTPTQVAQGFVTSAEFLQVYGTLSAGDFVTVMYQNVLHRGPDPGGQQYWTNLLLHGVSEATVLVGFSDSLENRAQTAGATHANWVLTLS